MAAGTPIRLLARSPTRLDPPPPTPLHLRPPTPAPPAMAIDLASPLVPGAFLALACLGSLARAAVGVAAGATHAALTQHFSRAAGSAAADLTAKADSRERAINIVGSVLGMGVAHAVAGARPRVRGRGPLGRAWARGPPARAARRAAAAGRQASGQPSRQPSRAADPPPLPPARPQTARSPRGRCLPCSRGCTSGRTSARCAASC
jgi:hypothetical protein